MTRRALPLLPLLLAALPLAAQSFGDSPAFGGSSVRHQCRSMRLKAAVFARKSNLSSTKTCVTGVV